jgi:hypothetical protein
MIEMTTKKDIKIKLTQGKSTVLVKRKTVSDIAREQGVKPLNPDDNGKNWPKDEDYDEWIGAIRESRKDD